MLALDHRLDRMHDAVAQLKRLEDEGVALEGLVDHERVLKLPRRAALLVAAREQRPETDDTHEQQS